MEGFPILNSINLSSIESQLTILPPETFITCYQSRSISYFSYNRKVQIEIEKKRKRKNHPKIENIKIFLDKSIEKSNICFGDKVFHTHCTQNKENKEKSKIYALEGVSFLSI